MPSRATASLITLLSVVASGCGIVDAVCYDAATKDDDTVFEYCKLGDASPWATYNQAACESYVDGALALLDDEGCPLEAVAFTEDLECSAYGPGPDCAAVFECWEHSLECDERGIRVDELRFDVCLADRAGPEEAGRMKEECAAYTDERARFESLSFIETTACDPTACEGFPTQSACGGEPRECMALSNLRAPCADLSTAQISNPIVYDLAVAWDSSDEGTARFDVYLACSSDLCPDGAPDALLDGSYESFIIVYYDVAGGRGNAYTRSLSVGPFGDEGQTADGGWFLLSYSLLLPIPSQEAVYIALRLLRYDGPARYDTNGICLPLPPRSDAE